MDKLGSKEITSGNQGGGYKIKNVEMLRFLTAWAVVGFHIVYLDLFNKFGLGFLKPYLLCGGDGAGCFFVLAFYWHSCRIVAQKKGYLGMGALTAHIVKCITKQPEVMPNNRLVTWGFTLAEVVLTGVLLVRFFAARCINLLNPLLTMLCFSAILVLFVTKRGYFSRLLENKLSSFLGRYAYAIFVVHTLVLSSARVVILPYFRAEAVAHPWVVLGCIAGTIMLLAMAGYHLVECPIMRFCGKYSNLA